MRFKDDLHTSENETWSKQMMGPSIIWAEDPNGTVSMSKMVESKLFDDIVQYYVQSHDLIEDIKIENHRYILLYKYFWYVLMN